MKNLYLYNSDSIVLVDDADMDVLKVYKWYLRDSQVIRYALNGTKRGQVRLHREIMGSIAKDLVVNHRDGNTLNNTRNNLRLLTHSENSFLYSIYSKKKGSRTTIDKTTSGKYRARITCNKNRITLGSFVTWNEAQDAWLKAVSEYYPRLLSEILHEISVTSNGDWYNATYQLPT